VWAGRFLSRCIAKTLHDPAPLRQFHPAGPQHEWDISYNRSRSGTANTRRRNCSLPAWLDCIRRITKSNRGSGPIPVLRRRRLRSIAALHLRGPLSAKSGHSAEFFETPFWHAPSVAQFAHRLSPKNVLCTVTNIRFFGRALDSGGGRARKAGPAPRRIPPFAGGNGSHAQARPQPRGRPLQLGQAQEPG